MQGLSRLRNADPQGQERIAIPTDLCTLGALKLFQELAFELLRDHTVVPHFTHARPPACAGLHTLAWDILHLLLEFLAHSVDVLVQVF